jgi:hypothetical protein
VSSIQCICGYISFAEFSFFVFVEEMGGFPLITAVLTKWYSAFFFLCFDLFLTFSFRVDIIWWCAELLGGVQCYLLVCCVTCWCAMLLAGVLC